jgi:hypothetical protein
VFFWPFLVSAPLDLQEAADAAARGDYGDLDAAEILLEFAPLSQPPYFLAGVGLAIGILCGLTFSRLVSERLDAWKQDRLPLLPLGRVQTILPGMGLLLGVTLFIGGSLQVFGFAPGAALLLAFLLSLATGGALWVQLVQLMQQCRQMVATKDLRHRSLRFVETLHELIASPSRFLLRFDRATNVQPCLFSRLSLLAKRDRPADTSALTATRNSATSDEMPVTAPRPSCCQRAMCECVASG